MLIRSGEFDGHNAKTVQVPSIQVDRNPHTEAALEILKPGEAIHQLFMATSDFYVNHLNVQMSPEVISVLRTMVTRQERNVDQILEDAICVLQRCEAASDQRVKDALGLAQLSSLAHSHHK